ncbi:DEAD/DEAH box helicase [Aurantivibrio plasticivorans]
MLFEDLGLAEELLRAVREQNYTNPTPIQEKSIPVIINGRDVLAGAQTGTGKTAGFTLPILHRLSQRPPLPAKKFRHVKVLIVVPTRELASQVSDSVETYGKYLSVRTNVVFGGVKISPQIFKLRRGCDILVATPGRLLDLVNQNVLDLSRVETLVLDEADRMLDMGFLPDIRRILAELPESRQNLLFSATYSQSIRDLANSILNTPEVIEVASRNSVAEKIRHVVHPVEQHRKRELLSHLIGMKNWQQVLVFTKTKRGADRVARQLTSDGLRADSIHGDKTQGARSKALADFKHGKIRVLVATDIAARGIDIDQLSHVINFDLPMVAEDYIHRIGRTGRAGNSGVAISLVTKDDENLLHAIERLLTRSIKKEVVEDYEVPFTLSKFAHKPTNAKRKGAAGRNNSRGSSGAKSGTGKPGKNHNGRKPQGNKTSGANSSGKQSSGNNSSGNRPTGSKPKSAKPNKMGGMSPPKRKRASTQGNAGNSANRRAG